jgi:ferrous iron transport protein B
MDTTDNNLEGCQAPGPADTPGKILLVGNPNVGKSVIFGLLTGKYVVVSNYPGTTVEISTGRMCLAGREFTLVDTPGVANLLPMSADEVVTRDSFLAEGVSFAVQVADAKNMARTLLLSLQMAEMGTPFVLDLNMADEAMERRIYIDREKLSQILGIPVVATVAVTRSGLDQLKRSMEAPARSTFKFKYNPILEEAIEKISLLLPPSPISHRSLALMILAEDSSIVPHLKKQIDDSVFGKILDIVRQTKTMFADPVSIVISQERLAAAAAVVDETTSHQSPPRTDMAYKIGNLCMHGFWGVPILAGVMMLMYYFVGFLAAGRLVDFMKTEIFERHIIPWVSGLAGVILPFPAAREMLVGEYGLVSMGLAYAIAIVFPIVSAFFLFFSLLEDTGYLPRLAIIANRTCSVMGLNGKAILPMVLGLGCGTMAALSARILDSKKERLLAILLISLGIPCSAQLGVMMAMLASMKPQALLIWLAVVMGSLVTVGWAANKVLPGETSEFILEIPPMRVPNLRNMLIKTISRVEWYLREALPIFLVATFALFLLQKMGMLTLLQEALKPLMVNVLGLPARTAETFLMGFLRRDYGSAQLLEMFRNGLLNGNQVLVAMVTMTLFLPCVAQLIIIIKEKGLKTALLISLFIMTFAFLAGGILNLILTSLGVML